MVFVRRMRWSGGVDRRVAGGIMGIEEADGIFLKSTPIMYHLLLKKLG